MTDDVPKQITPQELKLAMERVWRERRRLNSNNNPARWVLPRHHQLFNTGGYEIPIEYKEEVNK